MSVFEAILLGLVQGLTEFLPVSSSGHLVLLPRLLGWEPHPLSFDVMLHLGTMMAVLLYFGRDIGLLVRHGITDSLTYQLRFRCWSPHGRMALLITLGSVPAVVVGGLFNDWIEAHARQTWVVASLLALFALVMMAAERWPGGQSTADRLDARRALFIGVAQALALVPGVSRSGATISAGMFAGLSRGAASRFSFLLATPVIVAASVKELPNLRHASTEGVSSPDLGMGFLVSFVVGLAAIHLFLRFVAARPLHIFGLYRIGFAILVLLVLGVR